MSWLWFPILLLPPLQPPNPQRAMVAALEGRELAKTQAHLEQLTRREPTNARTWVQLAQVYSQRKKTE